MKQQHTYRKITLILIIWAVFFVLSYMSVKADDDFELADEYGGGTTSSGYILDANDQAGTGDTIFLQFGSTLARTLSYEIDSTRFTFNDDLRIEGNNSVIGQLWVADDHDVTDSDGYLNLGVNNSMFERIFWNAAADNFEISDDLDLNLAELKELRIENLAAAPSCDAASCGRMYYDTGNTNTFVCDGSSWTQIDGGSTALAGIIGEFYDNTGGVDVNASSPVPIPWDREIRKDSGITHSTTINNTRVTLDDAGWYKASYNISHESRTNARKNVRCRARLNGSAFIIPSDSYSYSRNTIDEWATNVAVFIFETTAGSAYYEIVCHGEGSGVGSAVANTVAGQSWTVIERIGELPAMPVTLDDAYDDDSVERTVTVDSGDVSWDASGGYNFIIDLQDVGSLFVVYDEPTDTTPFIIDDTGNVGIGLSNPDAKLDIEVSGEAIEIGDGGASDTTINFDDGTERSFGWDDSEESFSTFDN